MRAVLSSTRTSFILPCSCTDDMRVRITYLQSLDVITVPTSKRGEHPRGMPLLTRMLASIECHPRVISVEKCAPYHWI
jgi:hypothetical protein